MSQNNLYGELWIHCAMCGRKIDQMAHNGHGAWFNSASKNHVCSKECCEALDKSYYHAILNPIRRRSDEK